MLAKPGSIVVLSCLVLIAMPGSVASKTTVPLSTTPEDSGHVSKKIEPAGVTYESSGPNHDPVYTLSYEENRESDYLVSLSETYDLRKLIRNATSDVEKVSLIAHWVRSQWEHDGTNVPSHPDALTILREARQGKQFRCVEYAIVTTACLNAVGMTARTVGLYTKDVETTRESAAHVATEVYLADRKKWAFVDTQWGTVPQSGDTPLNAVELEDAISLRDERLTFSGLSGMTRYEYIRWIRPYLYYIDTAFDNGRSEEGTEFDSREKMRLMLVPVGAKEPRTFQIFSRIDNCVYTRSLDDFYEEPNCMEEHDE